MTKRSLLKRVFVPAASAAALIFASCNNDPQEPTDIRFEIGIAPAGGAQDNFYNKTWTNGDQIGLYIVSGNAALQASGNRADNIRITYNNGRWEYPELQHPAGTTLGYYAYYPYTEGLASPLKIALSVAADQSDRTAISGGYLLTAAATGVGGDDYPVRLTFSHAMAMIDLTVTGSGPGARMNNTVTTTLEGCRTAATLNLSTGAVTTAGQPTPVTMYRNEQPEDNNYHNSYTYRAMVPAQSVTLNTELFRFSQGPRALGHRLSTALNLNSAAVTPYQATLNVSLEPHQYAIGDLYPYAGIVAGIVNRVDEGGTGGRVTCLEETKDCRWSTEDVNLSTGGAIGDGVENMRKVREQNNTFASYPAFAAIHRLNPPGTVYSTATKDIWYLPSSKELSYMFVNREANNMKIESVGGTAIGTYSYWSSSESTESHAMFRSHTWSGGNLKNAALAARAMMDF